jgi:tetratricopeptide (TPR) repeat protein
MMTWPSRRTLVIASAVVVGVLIVGAAATVWYTTSQRAASGVYAEALTNAQRSGAAGGDPAAAAARLEAALAQYPSARHAADAAYELGNLRYAQRQYPTARGAYEIALAKRPTATIRTLSRAGVAYTWEAEGNFGKAVDTFQAGFTSLKPGDFLYEQLGLDLARAQELAGQRDAAIGTYRKLLKDLPKTSRGEEIRARLATLGATP